MPTRWYLPSTATPDVSPAFDAEWDVTDAVTVGDYRGQMVRTPSGSPVVEQRITKPTSNVLNQDAIAKQFVSEALAAQTISGTVKGQIRTQHTSASANDRAQIIVRVVSNDGSTVRGVLYAGDPETLSGSPTSEFSTSNVNRRFPRGTEGALSPLAISAGDRLVVEVGVRWHTTSTSTYGSELHFYDDAVSDLPENETEGAALNPWVEFSGTIAEQGSATEHPLTADLAGSSTVSATTITASAPLASDVAGSSLAAATTLVMSLPLSADLAGSSDASATTLTMTHALSGDIGGESSVSAMLYAPAPPYVRRVLIGM